MTNLISKLGIKNKQLRELLKVSDKALQTSKEYNAELVVEGLKIENELDKYRDAVKEQCDTCTMNGLSQCTECNLFELIEL